MYRPAQGQVASLEILARASPARIQPPRFASLRWRSPAGVPCPTAPGSSASRSQGPTSGALRDRAARFSQQDRRHGRQHRQDRHRNRNMPSMSPDQDAVGQPGGTESRLRSRSAVRGGRSGRVLAEPEPGDSGQDKRGHRCAGTPARRAHLCAIVPAGRRSWRSRCSAAPAEYAWRHQKKARCRQPGRPGQPGRQDPEPQQDRRPPGGPAGAGSRDQAANRPPGPASGRHNTSNTPPGRPPGRRSRAIARPRPPAAQQRGSRPARSSTPRPLAATSIWAVRPARALPCGRPDRRRTTPGRSPADRP